MWHSLSNLLDSVTLGCRRSEDRIDPVQNVVGKPYPRGGRIVFQLRDLGDSDDRARDVGVPQAPGERQLSKFGARALVFIAGRTDPKDLT